MYMVHRIGSLEDLIEIVNMYMKKGWKPVGGIQIYFDDERSLFLHCQAMIKE